MTTSYLSKTKKSKMLYDRAKRVLPTGVSYILCFMEPYPFYTAWARGSKLVDVDGNEYIDFWMGHHALIFGHSPPNVMREVKRQLDRGTHYGTSHELEIALAEQVVKMIPSVEMIRFTNSGTEANMYATRLARTYHTHLIEKGIFFLPAKSASLSTAHTKADIEKLLVETEGYLKNL